MRPAGLQSGSRGEAWPGAEKEMLQVGASTTKQDDETPAEQTAVVSHRGEAAESHQS